MSNALLPHGVAGVPCPALDVGEAAHPRSGERAFHVARSLLIDPSSESVAVKPTLGGDKGVAVLTDVPLQQPEPELPRCCGLLDQAHIEGAGEVSADSGGQVVADFRRQ